jgi:hypothetical protein
MTLDTAQAGRPDPNGIYQQILRPRAPAKEDQCEQAAGHHPSSLTDPDDAERETGIYVKCGHRIGPQCAVAGRLPSSTFLVVSGPPAGEKTTLARAIARYQAVPWAPGVCDRFVTISTELVQGRRVRRSPAPQGDQAPGRLLRLGAGLQRVHRCVSTRPGGI